MSEPHMTQAQCEAFMADLHVGVLAVTSDQDRSPLATPIWYAYEPGGDVTIFTGGEGTRNRKMRLLETEGKATFTVQQEAPPYKYVTIEGTVRRDPAPTRDDFRRIVSRYIPADGGEAFVDQNIGPGAALYRITPTKWSSVDFSQGS